MAVISLMSLYIGSGPHTHTYSHTFSVGVRHSLSLPPPTHSHTHSTGCGRRNSIMRLCLKPHWASSLSRTLHDPNV